MSGTVEADLLVTNSRRVAFGGVGQQFPAVLMGVGAPTEAAENGSVYCRQDAPDPSSMLYLRQAGAWWPVSTSSVGEQAFAGAGTLVADAGATFGYTANVPNGVATLPLQYPIPASTTLATIRINVTANALTASATTFTLYRNGVATTISVSYAFGETGQKSATGAFVFATGGFDIRSDNPGNAADVGRAISWSGEVFLL